MSAFNLLHLVTKSQPVALRACGLPSGNARHLLLPRLLTPVPVSLKSQERRYSTSRIGNSHSVAAPVGLLKNHSRCLHGTGTCRNKKNCKVFFTQQELRKRLTPLQYHVTQEKGTESAFAGEYTHQTTAGTYKCVVCGTPLFKSETKFESSSGWPSFYDVISLDTIAVTDDFSHGMHRVETSCSQCGAHLGHLFDDGPRPTGKRYCINSASLSFAPDDGSSADADSSPTKAGNKEL